MIASIQTIDQKKPIRDKKEVEGAAKGCLKTIFEQLKRKLRKAAGCIWGSATAVMD